MLECAELQTRETRKSVPGVGPIAPYIRSPKGSSQSTRIWLFKESMQLVGIYKGEGGLFPSLFSREIST
jgi:hypothetical protein